MSVPIWITPAGQLGIVPELDYYEFPLDAYDPAAGTLEFTRVSGKLPLGLQVAKTGMIVGVPVSELVGDNNVEYTFTIRVENTTTKKLADRTFKLTVTNVAPPVITSPVRNSFLGVFLDGSRVNIQLEAVEFLPGAKLTWSLKSGDLPVNLTLSPDGLLSGIILPIVSSAPGTTPNWDQNPWSYLGWDFPVYAIQKTFSFTIEVSDGLNYDQSQYTLEVFPRTSLTADNDDLTVDTTLLGTGAALTIDYGNKHNPLILTTQADFPYVREGSYFSFQIQSIDIDGDDVTYIVPNLVEGTFDEQDFTSTTSYPYLGTRVVNNTITEGLFPHATVVVNANTKISTSTLDYSRAEFLPGDQLKILNASNRWQMATVTDEVTVRITGNSKITASVGNFLTQDSSGANITVSNSSPTTGFVQFVGQTYTGSINTLLPTYQVFFSGSITANAGNYITQPASGANARIIDNTVNGSTANVIFVSGGFINGSGGVLINGVSAGVVPTANIKDTQNITLSVSAGDIITQDGSSGNAVVTASASDATTLIVRYNVPSFNPLAGNIKVNGTDANVWIQSYVVLSTNLGTAATVGQYLTQTSTGANAIVTGNVIYGNVIPVQFLSNTFAVGSGNITLSGSNIAAYPSNVFCSTDVTGNYNSAYTFDVNSPLATSIPWINGTPLYYSNITAMVSVGVTLGSLAVEGTVGFDEAKFDQGTLSLPYDPATDLGLSLNADSGWITGIIPHQTIAQQEYEFQITVHKTNDINYSDSQLYTLTVLGDLNNRIDWITSSDLGTIETGKISDLFVYAVSALGKTLFYEIASVYPERTGINYQRLPQGLILTPTGLISGRVSFETFSLDNNTTTLDNEKTTFDLTYRFTVAVRDAQNTINSTRTFTLKVRPFDRIPYENLYLKALPTRAQRTMFEDIVNDNFIFPPEKIYRIEDPWFGLAKDIRTLFLAGLSPSTAAEYAAAAANNHFNKRLLFGDIKTAQVLDNNFNVKYEVVYIEIKDENSITTTQGLHATEDGPPNMIELGNNINPYYDLQGTAYTTAYPNSFVNMENRVATTIGFQDKGVLPDWMTSKQKDGRQLGFQHAVVLAYVKPGESDLIKYRLIERDFNFNSIDFTVDRYALDNIYSANFDIASNTFIASSETTFDRYPALINGVTYIGTVEYAVSTPYDQIHQHSVNEIKEAGGLDGITNFKDGDLIVFAQQEYAVNGSTVTDYFEGWYDAVITWDDQSWAFNADTTDSDSQTPYDPNLVPANPGPYDYTPGEQWDQASYVPGRTENLLDPNIVNKRIGVWQINIDSSDIVTLSLKRFQAASAGSISGNILTVGGTVSAYFDTNMRIYGNGISANTYIVSQLTSSEESGMLGKRGTYLVTNTQTVSETEIYQDVKFYDSLYVRNGFTYGGTYIYYDPVVKEGNSVPNYSIIPQQITINYTRFDHSGTKFYDYRDSYIVPEQGDKYIKFKQTGVFT